MISYRDLSVSFIERYRNLHALNKMLKSGYIIDEPSIQLLENRIASFCNRKYGVSVNSGTSAIYLTYSALGLEKNDEVIVPCIGIVPIVNPLTLLGLKPIFVDVNYDYNLNSDIIEDNITNKTKAIMAVNWAGRICDMDKLSRIASENNLYLIEDASQSFGARYKSRIAGSFGHISIISMNAMKVFGTYGEAGIILTDDESISSKLYKMRYNGLINKVVSDYVSLNFRLNTIQALILLNNFPHLNKKIEKRRKIANIYNAYLPEECYVPKENQYEYNTHFTYNIMIDDRERLFKYLSDIEIETQKRDELLLPHQLPDRNSYKNLKFPVGDIISKKSLSLPIYDKLKERDVSFICEKISEYYNK